MTGVQTCALRSNWGPPSTVLHPLLWRIAKATARRKWYHPFAMPDSDRDKTYWGSLAHAYGALGPPLLPTSADIAYMEGAVAVWAGRHPARRTRAVLLGRS